MSARRFVGAGQMRRCARGAKASNPVDAQAQVLVVMQIGGVDMEIGGVKMEVLTDG